ncbi:MAG: hypothetical protein AAB836_00985 [Patescibacteria group bacterium]
MENNIWSNPPLIKPIFKSSFEMPIPGSKRLIEICFDPKSSFVEDASKEKVLSFLQNGYAYILSVLGEDAFINMKNMLRLKRQFNHDVKGGNEMSINVSRLESAGDLYTNELEQSLITHEILHHFFWEEHFSMFIEMIYMLDKGQVRRFDVLKSILQENRFAPPYLDGLSQISEWLGFDDIEKMLEAFPSLDLTELKRIFKEKYDEYCESDAELAGQLKNFKANLLSNVSGV